jgi:hypothetical protein
MTLAIFNNNSVFFIRSYYLFFFSRILPIVLGTARTYVTHYKMVQGRTLCCTLDHYIKNLQQRTKTM